MPERQVAIMSRKAKKVIMFIVEGPSDAAALSPIFKNIFENQDVRFHVVRGDLTIDKDIKTTNAIKTIHARIKQEMYRYHFKMQDMLKIIHLVDTDGAFIPDDSVVWAAVDKVQYENNRILSHQPDTIIARNNKKAAILRLLHSTNKVNKIPYSVHYFSRNLEHVLHNNHAELTNVEKESMADGFADTYRDNLDTFRQFIASEEFVVAGDYPATWAFIMQDLNSLHRHCNLHLILP